jgi:type I restriction enzyme M protein
MMRRVMRHAACQEVVTLRRNRREQARSTSLDYQIFMAFAEKIGHDKRGNIIYRRTADGEDALVTHIETINEIDPQSGQEVRREI